MMQQSAYNISKKPIGIGVMTALGVVLSASTATPLLNGNFTSNLNRAFVYEGISPFGDYGGELCVSSTLSEEVRGDVMASHKDVKRYENHEKISVQLQILQVRKHVSQFDFDEEYEEL